MFKEIYQCIPDIGILSFCLFNSFHCFHLPRLPPNPWYTTAFTTHPYIHYLHRFLCLMYHLCSIILFSFPSFPKFHSIVPLFQTYFVCEFMYDRDFFVYVYLLDHFPDLRGNMWPLSFRAFQLTWCLPITSIYLQTTCQYFLKLSKIALCIYTTFSWSIHQF
jgi:hypothetical protein